MIYCDWFFLVGVPLKYIYIWSNKDTNILNLGYRFSIWYIAIDSIFRWVYWNKIHILVSESKDSIHNHFFIFYFFIYKLRPDQNHNF